jgi:hypothetical protein
MPTINTTSDWLCSGAFRYPDRRIGKERTGPDRDERFHYFSMAPNWAIGSEKIMLLCIAGGHNLNAALAQPEKNCFPYESYDTCHGIDSQAFRDVPPLLEETLCSACRTCYG